MEKQVMNILLGVKTENVDLYVSGFKDTIEAGNEIKVAQIDVCETVEEIDKALEKGIYDVLVCLELLGERSIANGSLKKWKKQKNLKRIILVVKNEKKASLKLGRLYRNDYYDAVFIRDLPNCEILTDLILNGRSEEEAVIYYQIEGMDIVEQARQEREALKKQEETIAAEKKTSYVEDIQRGFEETLKSVNDQITSVLLTEEEDFFEEKLLLEQTYRKADEKESLNLYGENVGKSSDFDQAELVLETEYRKKDEDRESVLKSMNKTKSEEYMQKNLKTGKASVMPYEAYIIAAVSDSALIIEVPGAHFEKDKLKLQNQSINIIMPQYIK